MIRLIDAAPHPEQLIGSRTVVQGSTGAGKTYAIRKILETTQGLMQHIVLDVEDEFFTLRERFDYMLIGGETADAPLVEDTADRLATVLLETGMSAIIQLNERRLDERRRIIGKFIAGLMKAPRKLWHPVLLVLDETHNYAPQSRAVESSESITHMATAGRKRGFGAIFGTQRLSLISKDVLGQCQNRLMGGIEQAIDRRAAADMLGFAPSSPEARGMMALKRQFWAQGPAFYSQPDLIQFSETVTTHLMPGSSQVPVPPAPEKVRAMLEHMATIAAAPKATATDSAPAIADRAEIEGRAFARGYEEGRADGRRTGYLEGQAAAYGHMATVIEEARNAVAQAPKDSPPLIEKPKHSQQVVAQRTAETPSEGLSPSARKIIEVIRRAHPLPLSFEAAAKRAGVSKQSSAFPKYRREVEGSAEVVPQGGRLIANLPLPKLEGDNPVEFWRSKLPASFGNMLRALARAYPARLSRTQIADNSGVSPTSSGLGAGLRELIDLGLIELQQGEYRLSSDLVMESADA